MKKFTVLLIISIFTFKLSEAQLATFNFNTDPFLNPSSYNLNLLVSDIALSAGTISTNIITGTYFIDEPYIEESGGWNATDELNAKYLIVDVYAQAGYKFSITNVAFEIYATDAGPSAVSVLMDNELIFTNNVASASLQTINQDIIGYSNLTHVSIKIAGWDNGSRITTGAGAFRMDNLIIDGVVELIPPNDSSSVIKQTSFIIPNEIFSVTHDADVPVMEFVLSDSASGDGFSTFVDSLIITPGSTNEFSNWATMLSDAKLVFKHNSDTIAGVIGNSTLSFYTSNFEVNEGIINADTCRVLIKLNPILPDADTKQFEFLLDSSKIYCNPDGSKVGWGKASTGLNNLMVQVEATELKAIVEPVVLWQDSTFAISISAVDVYGNIDKNESGQVHLSLIDGDGYLQSGSALSKIFQEGEVFFNDLKFTGSDTISIKIQSDNFDDYIIENQLFTKPMFFDDVELGNLQKWNNTSDWEASTSNSLSGSYSIKHNLTGVEGFSYLVSEFDTLEMNHGKVVWRMILHNGNFDPTSANRFWYYLMASESNLLSNTNSGYAIGVNYLGSNDTLSLWKVDDSGNKTLLIETGFEWNENDTVAIEVIRQVPGIWQVGYTNSLDFSGLIYSQRFEDKSFVDLPNHGLAFQYSSTRAGLLWCDDISVGQLNTPPQIANILAIASDTILLRFTEPVNQIGAENLNNYQISSPSDPLVFISKVLFDLENPDQVKLIVNGLKTTEYLVVVSDLSDWDGSIMLGESISFSYELASAFGDIVFSEVMFDPYPPVGLPETDYLEIYNRSLNSFHLKGWQLNIDELVKTFPDTVIEGGEYLVISSSSYSDVFSEFGKFVGILSTTSLTNNGKPLKLISPTGVIIDSLFYKPNWISDEGKINGGWSLERIDPDNLCGTSANWNASVSEMGGTPGKINSINASNLDFIAPKAIQIIHINSAMLLIKFSEAINRVALVAENFRVDDLGDVSVAFDDTDASLIILQFENEMGELKNYDLSLSGIADYCGNILNDSVIHFLYHEALLYNLVINEIMANPVPSVGLPEIEYIELCNHTDYEIQAYQWLIKVGNSARALPFFKIPPHSYLILYDKDAEDSFYSEINSIGVEDLPALPLSGTITLSNSHGELICQTQYSSSWFVDDFKADGGFSLERIDFNNPDESILNWEASNNQLGGTPGYINSVYRNNPDAIPPDLIRAFPVNDTLIGLQFSEPMNNNISLNQIQIANESDFIDSVFTQNNNLSLFFLSLTGKLLSGITYSIRVSDDLTDITGNVINNRDAKLMLPIKASPGDLIINEILWNPNVGGVDFVELYNRSAFTLNLKQFFVATFDDVGNIKTPKTITGQGALLFPSEYIVLSINQEIIKEQYWIESEFAFIDMDALPTFSNEQGSAVIIDTNGVVLDYLYYTDDMHFGLLKDTKGVSLERVHFNRSSQEKSNWHSAAEMAGWATPGYKNSMFTEENSSDESIFMERDVFSPDNDGVNDVLYIHYNFGEPGYVANVIVFDAKGRLVKTLANNELLSTNGVLAWDGLNETNNKVIAGVYIIYFEIFNLNGDVKKFKKVCAVNARIR